MQKIVTAMVSMLEIGTLHIVLRSTRLTMDSSHQERLHSLTLKQLFEGAYIKTTCIIFSKKTKTENLFRGLKGKQEEH